MSRQINMPGVDADEDELLAELEDLQAEDLADGLGQVDLGPQAASSGAASSGAATGTAALPDAPLAQPFPQAPMAKPQAKQMSDEERELAELEASMAM